MDPIFEVKMRCAVMKNTNLPPRFYLSITGLKPKGLFSFLLFWRYAIPSKIQADSAPGILYSKVKNINGIQHTLTAWQSQAHMKNFISKGAHLKAMKIFRKIATGKTLGFETDKIPSWEEVHQLWKDRGKEY